MIVPDQCVPLLKEQRTGHVDIQAEYGADIRRDYENIAPHLPDYALRVMDIGCGMSGIDVHLSAHYRHSPEVWLVDKGGVSPSINSGYCERSESFAHYHDWGAAMDLLTANNVPAENIRCVDLLHEPFPAGEFDVVISLLSMGFHYPVDTHPWSVRPGGVFIADIRTTSDNWSRLDNTQVIYESSKYKRVVIRC